MCLLEKHLKKSLKTSTIEKINLSLDDKVSFKKVPQKKEKKTEQKKEAITKTEIKKDK